MTLTVIDLLIVVLILLAARRGRDSGLLRQAFSVGGFWLGLFIGLWFATFLSGLATSASDKELIIGAVTIGFGLVFGGFGESIGFLLSRIAGRLHFGPVDSALGAIAAAVATLIACWVLAPLVSTLPNPALAKQVENSQIITYLDNRFSAPSGILDSISSAVGTTTFGQTFDQSLVPGTKQVALPSDAQVSAAVAKAEPSVLKVGGSGCGGLSLGSGFLVASGTLVTNAHVVAGIAQPLVRDDSGRWRRAKVVLFDPETDLAILKISTISGTGLNVDSTDAPAGTGAAVLGYPGGGDFTAVTAAITGEVTAQSNDIYGQGTIDRSVYALHADIQEGNSGGPLLSTDGTVLGVVFAKATDANTVGYALTSAQVLPDITRGERATNSVSTGSCIAS